MPHSSGLFLVMPLSCIITIIVGFYHIRQIQKENTPLHESIAALSSYLRDALLVFLKRQLLLIAITLGFLILGSIGLSQLNLHGKSLAALITWGVGWSCIIGYFAIRKSTQITGDLIQQSLTNTDLWKKNITHMGWALTLLPLGILTLLLTIWMGIFQALVRLNIFQTGDRLMQSAGIAGPWTPEIMNNPAFINMHQSELGIVLLAFCFGAMVQTFLVRVTTQTMCHATDRTCRRLDYFYPGTDANDLRNPISMAHHIGHYVDQVWGKISVMINTYLMVLLTSTAIMIAAVRESPLHYDVAMVRAPFMIACFALLAASIVSLWSQKTLFKQVRLSAMYIGAMILIGVWLGIVPLKTLACVLLSLAFALLMFYLKEKKDMMPHAQDLRLSGLKTTWNVVFLTTGWLIALFTICHNDTHILLGLAGIATGLVTFMGATLSYPAFLHRNTFIAITMSSAKILHVDQELTEKIEDTLHHIQKHRPFTLLSQTLLMTGSLLFLFFIFFEMLPYWLQKINHPNITQKLLLMGQKHLAVFNLTDIENVLEISPTKAPFLLGIFLAIGVILGLGVFWLWRSSQIEGKLFTQAEKQLQADDRILKGEYLPSYQEGVQIATTHAYQSSFGLALFICIGTLLVTEVLGFGGLSGLFMGMIFCSALSGLYAFCQAQWGDHAESELSASMIGLVTQAMLLFAILFSVFLLYFGHGL